MSMLHHSRTTPHVTPQALGKDQHGPVDSTVFLGNQLPVQFSLVPWLFIVFHGFPGCQAILSSSLVIAKPNESFVALLLSHRLCCPLLFLPQWHLGEAKAKASADNAVDQQKSHNHSSKMFLRPTLHRAAGQQLPTSIC